MGQGVDPSWPVLLRSQTRERPPPFLTRYLQPRHSTVFPKKLPAHRPNPNKSLIGTSQRSAGSALLRRCRETIQLAATPRIPRARPRDTHPAALAPVAARQSNPRLVVWVIREIGRA